MHTASISLGLRGEVTVCVKSLPPTREDTSVSYDFLVFGGISKRLKCSNALIKLMRPQIG